MQRSIRHQRGMVLPVIAVEIRAHRGRRRSSKTHPPLICRAHRFAALRGRPYATISSNPSWSTSSRRDLSHAGRQHRHVLGYETSRSDCRYTKRPAGPHTTPRCPAPPYRHGPRRERIRRRPVHERKARRMFFECPVAVIPHKQRLLSEQQQVQIVVVVVIHPQCDRRAAGVRQIFRL